MLGQNSQQQSDSLSSSCVRYAGFVQQPKGLLYNRSVLLAISGVAKIVLLYETTVGTEARNSWCGTGGLGSCGEILDLALEYALL